MKRGMPATLDFPLDYITVLFRPYVTLGVLLLVLWLLSRMALLSWADLSPVVRPSSDSQRRAGQLLHEAGDARDAGFPTRLHHRFVPALCDAGRAAAGALAALAHGAVELGRFELRRASHLRGLRFDGACRPGLSARSDRLEALDRHRADRGWSGPGERRRPGADIPHPPGGDPPMRWLFVGIIVAATAAGEVLQAVGMRRHGEVRDFRPSAIGRAMAALARNRFVIAAVAAMAVAFFANLGLLSVADLSFAVPATAITCVLETVLAKYVLKERVNWLRWVGASLVICGVALVSL